MGITHALKQALYSKVPIVVEILNDPNKKIRPKTISPWAQKSMAGIYTWWAKPVESAHSDVEQRPSHTKAQGGSPKTHTSV